MTTTEARARGTGLLLAMMEPPAVLEEEFQQWYDREHFPERVGTNGFLTAMRGICIDGWPRYVAMYDLADVDVLHGPDYAKIAGNSYSPWTNHIVGRVWGQYRAEGSQIYPGEALLGGEGAAARISVWRFRHVPAASVPLIVSGMRALYEDQPETAQLRVFEARQPDGIDCLAIAELHAPYTPPPGAVSALGDALKHLDMVNVYTLYRRRWAGTAP